MSDELQEQIASIDAEKPSEPVASEQPTAQPEQPADDQPVEGQAPEQSAEPDGEQPPEQQPEKQEDDQPQRRNRTREYISSLRQDRNAAMRRADEAEQRLAQLQERLQEPAEFDEDDFDASQAHRTRQMLNEDRLEDAQRERDKAISEHREKGIEAYYAALDGAADRFPGLANEVERMPAVAQATADFLIESDAAPELTHWLVNNPHEAAALARKSPIEQTRELARREARIQAAPPARKVSQAPEPPPRVQSTSAPAQPTPENMAFGDFQKWLLGQMSS